MQKTFVAQAIDAGLRLDLFLSKMLPVSRAQAQEKIRLGYVLLNKKPAKSSAHVKTNDSVSIDCSEKPSSSKDSAVLFDVPIIYEDDYVLVINKPRGIAVHPDTKHTQNTIVNWAIKHYPPIAKVGEDMTRPGIVHRLDKETSGVMILAKTQIMFEWLKKAFHDRLVKKQYLVLVSGTFPENIKFIDLDIGRSPNKPKQLAISSIRAKQKSIKVRPAKTEFKIIKKFKKYTLLEARPLSGRTHQIRVHLASAGYPVVGDKIYGKKQPNDLKSGAMFLHSQTLTVPFPDENSRQWNAPTPDDLKIILRKLDN
ncbi:MAG: RluA family pseudouridine synthase [Patescibacteria group bacterium]